MKDLDIHTRALSRQEKQNGHLIKDEAWRRSGSYETTCLVEETLSICATVNVFLDVTF